MKQDVGVHDHQIIIKDPPGDPQRTNAPTFKCNINEERHIQEGGTRPRRWESGI